MNIKCKVQYKILTGNATTKNNINISYAPCGDNAYLEMYKASVPNDHQVTCTAEAARELAGFFNQLAEILEGK